MARLRHLSENEKSKKKHLPTLAKHRIALAISLLANLAMGIALLWYN